MYASYTYGFGPNAASNREGLVNAVENLSASWQARMQSENWLLVGLVKMVEGVNNAISAMPNPDAMTSGDSESTNILRTEPSYAEAPWLNAKPGSKKGTKGLSLGGADFDSPDPQKPGRPRRNYDQNAQVDAAIKEIEKKYQIKIDENMRAQIHDALHELENPGYRDVVNLIRDEFSLGGQ